jgi:hypothetical protein
VPTYLGVVSVQQLPTLTFVFASVYRLPAQVVDATQALNRSAEVHQDWIE